MLTKTDFPSFTSRTTAGFTASWFWSMVMMPVTPGYPLVAAMASRTAAPDPSAARFMASKPTMAAS